MGACLAQPDVVAAAVLVVFGAAYLTHDPHPGSQFAAGAIAASASDGGRQSAPW